ncbi:MAG: K(+)-transporting ATPase subunit F [Proteobacteria bacterium]|nr:K(+)-transporting ATPase subunit F [Pseudomonadota bacterium]
MLLITGIITAILFIYLLVALITPEIFP